MNYKGLISGLIGTTISATGLMVSGETLDHIVSIVCSVIGLLITIVVVLVIPFIKWLKNAREDGIITTEELDDLSNTLKDGKNAIDKHIKENKKEGE